MVGGRTTTGVQRRRCFLASAMATPAVRGRRHAGRSPKAMTCRLKKPGKPNRKGSMDWRRLDPECRPAVARGEHAELTFAIAADGLTATVVSSTGNVRCVIGCRSRGVTPFGRRFEHHDQHRRWIDVDGVSTHLLISPWQKPGPTTNSPWPTPGVSAICRRVHQTIIAPPTVTTHAQAPPKRRVGTIVNSTQPWSTFFGSPRTVRSDL